MTEEIVFRHGTLRLSRPVEPLRQNGVSADSVKLLTKMLYSLGARMTLAEFGRRYLAQREIGTCLHCGSHFAVFKHGARACGQTCRTALRNQKYWSENKETLNRNRRKKHNGRK